MAAPARATGRPSAARPSAARLGGSAAALVLVAALGIVTSLARGRDRR